MNYTLHQLQVFLKIVESKSITNAAKALNLTQPAISIQLKNLQNQFEIPLTEVIGKQIYITDFGREIAEIAQKIIIETINIHDIKLNYKGIISGALKIAIVSTGKYIMPYFLNDFLIKHPQIELKMDVTNKNKVIKSLENNEIDFALISVLPDKLQVEEEILLENHLYLIGNKESELDKSFQNKNILNEIPLIFREEGSATKAIMQDFISKNKILVKRKIELASNEAVKQAVIAGLGYSIMPLIGLHQDLLIKDLKIIPINGLPIKSVWRLIWLKNKKLSPLASSYLNFIKENKDNILNKNFSWIEKVNDEHLKKIKV